MLTVVSLLKKQAVRTRIRLSAVTLRGQQTATVTQLYHEPLHIIYGPKIRCNTYRSHIQKLTRCMVMLGDSRRGALARSVCLLAVMVTPAALKLNTAEM